MPFKDSKKRREYAKKWQQSKLGSESHNKSNIKYLNIIK